MSLPHEEAARAIYPSARNFRSIQAGVPMISRTSIGWVFVVDGQKSIGDRFAWITSDHEVTEDPQIHYDHAVRNLRSYVASFAQNKRRSTHIKVVGSGNATASKNGTAVTGIQFTEDK